MSPNGDPFYDAPGVIDAYRAGRPSGLSSPNEVMEEPAVLAALGDVSGRRVLDLGCGDASFGQRLLEHGATAYHGVDASTRMLSLARENLVGRGGLLTHAAIEDFSADDSSFDLVVSRLALHYVEPLGAVLGRCRRWLDPAGQLLITVVHPVITSHDARASTEEVRTSWVVDNYFRAGPRPQSWLGGSVTFYHRTVEQYVGTVLDAGFRLVGLSECEPHESTFGGDDDEYARRSRIPLFLLIHAQVA
jgi:ubiquinone/menaquinone biosynthesis C-methylase UbiE